VATEKSGTINPPWQIASYTNATSILNPIKTGYSAKRAEMPARSVKQMLY